jgi:hypothetical protein
MPCHVKFRPFNLCNKHPSHNSHMVTKIYLNYKFSEWFGDYLQHVMFGTRCEVAVHCES